MKKLIIGFFILSSSASFAVDTIKVSVKTNEQTAAGIGYAVNGKDSGGPGKSYSGQGPKNAKYVFGYRKKSTHGKNITCGSHTLNKDSNVTLVMKGSKCQSIVSQ